MKVEDLLDHDGSDNWVDYLTLLNLRNWDTIGDRPVTEQIYVHSKLLVADDRVAVLGSANINDRSMLGDRDSELAVVVTDDAPKLVKLDGVNMVEVGQSVHALRRGLWETIFGLRGGSRPASELSVITCLDSPAAPATWKEIQNTAIENANIYEKSFRFVPRNEPHADIGSLWPTSAIWPTWQYTLKPPPDERYERGSAGRLRYRMPFDSLFWGASERSVQEHSWNVAKDTLGRADEFAPKGVRGYITALPMDWTKDENNNSTMSLTVLANVDGGEEQDTMLASVPARREEEAMG